MKRATKFTISLLISGVAMAFQPHVAEAANTTLFDLLKKKRSSTIETREVEQEQQVRKPLPRVSGPSYYTYKVEGIRRFAIPEFVAPLVTGAIGDAQPEAAMPPIKVATDSSVADAMESYYKSEEDFLWIGGNEILDRAKAAMEVLSKAEEFGLNSQDYAVTVPQLSDDAVERWAQLATFEFELTAASLSFIQDNESGRVNPNKISGYHDFKRKTVKLGNDLVRLKNAARVDRYFAYRAPKGPHFSALKAELAKLKDAMGGPDDRIEIAAGTLIKPGRSHAELPNVIKGILKNGSRDLRLNHALTIVDYKDTEAYTPELVALVEDFQKEKGLRPDGVVGPATIRKIEGGDSMEDRYNKVVYAMERARWLPAELGERRVFINQPAFKAYYFEDGKQKLDMRVVVGKPSNQTSFFMDEIETVEFNPYWGVPRSIIVNEMLPKLRADPGYLDRLGYETSMGGRRVSSSSINWNVTDRVDVRQPPGHGNALGQLKILFPNKHNIYMHDTPSKSLFNRDTRAFSHGCVRLAEPKVMAAAVLRTDVGKISSEIATGQNHSVPVAGRIPVYVSYFTAWPNADGKVEFFEDIYKRDDYLQRAMDATSQARASSV